MKRHHASGSLVAAQRKSATNGCPFPELAQKLHYTAIRRFSVAGLWRK
jgi:hypothetical protein